TALEKACSAGRGAACAKLASTERDPAKAARLTEEACNGRDAASCLRLASKEPARAAQLRRKACDFGDQPTCAAIRAEEERATAALIGVGTILALSNSGSDVQVAAVPSGLVIAGRFP